ncbi:MAG: monovalent cation:proton antiporter-2 (CPA2) family protein [Pseudomonadota bacterium]
MEHGEMHMEDIFLSGFILLAASLAFVLLFRRFGLGAVLGYLLAGVLIGPGVLGLVRDAETILVFAEVGIVLLLFLVGLELAPARLWKLKRDIFGLGLAQVVLCGLAMAGLIYFLRNPSWEAALAIGLPLGLSSTAQVLPMLQSEGRLNTPTGERAFSILLFQDLSIIPLITIIAALSRAPQAENATAGWLLALYAVAAIIGLIIIGHYLLNPILKYIGRVAERELFIVAGLFAVFGSALLMASLGLSPALGAFVAGVMLADSPFRHELESDIDPFRSILLGLFFVSVGMMLDLGVIASNPFLVIGLAALLIATKVVLIFGLGKLFGMTNSAALVLGLLLSQGGEFGFVLFNQAQQALLIDPEAASLYGAVVTLSMVCTPFLMLLSRGLGGVKQKVDQDLEDPSQSEDSDALIIGHGRFGQAVGQILAGANLSLTFIDVKPEQIAVSGTFGRKVFYGDGTRIDLLRSAGADKADLLMFCMDERNFSGDQLEAIATAFPNARIFVRVYDRVHEMRLSEGGAEGLHREVMETAISMARNGLLANGLDTRSVEELISEYRDRDRQRLEVQMESGDMYAGMDMSFGTKESKAFDIDVTFAADTPGK